MKYTRPNSRKPRHSKEQEPRLQGKRVRNIPYNRTEQKEHTNKSIEILQGEKQNDLPIIINAIENKRKAVKKKTHHWCHTQTIKAKQEAKQNKNSLKSNKKTQNATQ
uniref:Uncharacterized protein n=1 Tax=Trypanosoma congolense (strain IL3000) TaxID=1068625 RepID=G0UR93_TRYCI|nr:hypothetical protein, unlikely [Trypanosoma congolense IL3000]